MLVHAGHRRPAALYLELPYAMGWEPIAHGAGVVARIEVQGSDVGEQAGGRDRAEGVARTAAFAHSQG